MPHRINSLICVGLSLCVWAQFAQAQSAPKRPAPGGARPAAKKPTVPSEEPRSSVPRIAREPAGNATLGEEPAETADPPNRPVRQPPRQRAMQGPDARQPAEPDDTEPEVVMQAVPPGMEDLLNDWEAHTKNITSLSCPISRIEFDIVFCTETRSIGKVYFENPDRGRIDFNPADAELLAKPGRVNGKGKPFKVSPGSKSKWICDGQKIYVLDVENKSYDLIEIPPQMQGQNITRSPLPFIFGMKAQDAMERFALKFGKFHNPDGTQLTDEGKPMRKALHILAQPREVSVRREYQLAEIIVDPETFQPMNLRTIDPSGNKETVYSFDLPKLKVGAKWLDSPFHVALPGWQLMHHHKAEPDQAPPRQAQRSEK